MRKKCFIKFFPKKSYLRHACSCFYHNFFLFSWPFEKYLPYLDFRNFIHHRDKLVRWNFYPVFIRWSWENLGVFERVSCRNSNFSSSVNVSYRKGSKWFIVNLRNDKILRRILSTHKKLQNRKSLIRFLWRWNTTFLFQFSWARGIFILFIEKRDCRQLYL